MIRLRHGLRANRLPLRFGYRCATALGCFALIVQALLPGAAHGAYDDYDALSTQLNGLVGQRSTIIVQLAQADGTAGALIARDALASLVPSLILEADTAQRTAARALRVPSQRAIVSAASAVDRSLGAGVLLGPHLASPSTVPQAVPTITAPRSWSEAVLTADALGFVPASSTLPSGSNVVPVMAPAALTPSPSATSQTTSLGPAQDTAPLHAVELGNRAVPISVIAPQARIEAPPIVQVPVPSVPTPAVFRGPDALGAYTTVTAAQRSVLAEINIPDGLPSTGLDSNRRVTQLDDVQRTLGHYTLNAPLGGSPVQVNAPGFLAPQVTWTFSSTTPLAGNSVLIIAGNGHADGGTLHDLSLHAAKTQAKSTQPPSQPGTSMSLALSPDGAAELTAVSTLTNTTTITTLARIDGVGNDPALQSALARERLTLTELSGVLQAGNAVYARLRPLYLIREQQFTQDLATVMASNATLEQAWWTREQAWRTYQAALTQWKQRRAAWDTYLARRSSVASPAASPQAPPYTPSPVLGTATALPTSTMAAQALPIGTVPPSPSPSTQGAPDPGSSIFAAPVGQLPPSPAQAPAAAVTPIFGVPAVATETATAETMSASPIATAPIETATAETMSASPTATVPVETATAVDSPTPPLGAPSVVISPSATDTPLVLPSPLPISSATPVAGGTTSATTAPQPPGPEPAAVPPPGLEPVFAPLPPPLPPLPPWIDAPPPVVPRSLSSSLAHGLGAFGYATMTAEQLLASGALDNLTGLIPPLKGVITTLWGGTTPWQSFHTGIDIAAPADTPVHAAAGGIVIYAGLAVPGDPTLSYGNCVMIMHNNHLSTLYGHMELGSHGLQVVPGQVVHQGQIIGYEGMTGWATGPHVHFETRLDNVQFNPLLLLDEHAITG